MKTIIQSIVDDFVADFTDRRGLRQEWEQIDPDIQEEIKAEWCSIVKRHLTAVEGDAEKRCVCPVYEEVCAAKSEASVCNFRTPYLNIMKL